MVGPDGRVYHLNIRKEDLADIVFLVGDQDRVTLFKDYFENIEMEHQCREFHSLTGWYKGKRMTALSTGIGTDNIDIVMTELDALANMDFEKKEFCGEHKRLTILRLGTCGAIQPDIPLGSLIFSHKSIGLDNTLNWYADRDKVCDLEMEKSFLSQVSWPAHQHDPYVVTASEKLCRLFEKDTVKGLTMAASGFYGPQGRFVHAAPAMPHMLDEFEAFRFGEWRITNFEMESSALLGLASILGHDAGTMCVAMANRHAKDCVLEHGPLIRKMITTALDKLAEA